MEIKGKRIFLTGGAGFIGSHLVESLVNQNKIVIYDNFERNAIQKMRCFNHKNITLIRGDVLEFEKLKKAMEESNIVIHLAAIAGIDTVIKSPTRTMKTNMIGSYNMLEAARELNALERVVIFSTSEVFGSYTYKSTEGDVTRMGAVGGARWTYAVSKLAAEHLAHSYFKEFGVPTVSVRPFNIYGPGQVGEGAVHHFVKRAISNEDIEIHGDGDQIRSWCYIDDIIECILLCLEKDEAVGNVFNIGNPKGTVTIYGLAMIILKICHSKSNIKFVPKLYTDVELRIPSIDKARQILGFEPKIDLEEGIRRTADWYWEEIYGNSKIEVVK